MEHKTTPTSLSPMNNIIQICSPKMASYFTSYFCSTCSFSLENMPLFTSDKTYQSFPVTYCYPDRHRSSFTFEVHTLLFAFEVAYRNYLRPFCILHILTPQETVVPGYTAGHFQRPEARASSGTRKAT